eukprot:GHVR01093853.1.p1 GENE.GHVR01093853.1~~GHVR01093853.1.p1  ORF type:complete len:492 (+),score=126.87 GHVR01093853.1:19-1494(+)
MGNNQSMLPYCPLALTRVDDDLVVALLLLGGISLEDFCELHTTAAHLRTRHLRKKEFREWLGDICTWEDDIIDTVFSQFAVNLEINNKNDKSNIRVSKSLYGKTIKVKSPDNIKKGKDPRRSSSDDEHLTGAYIDVAAFLSTVILLADLDKGSLYQLLFQFWQNGNLQGMKFATLNDMVHTTVRGVCRCKGIKPPTPHETRHKANVMFINLSRDVMEGVMEDEFRAWAAKDISLHMLYNSHHRRKTGGPPRYCFLCPLQLLPPPPSALTPYTQVGRIPSLLESVKVQHKREEQRQSRRHATMDNIIDKDIQRKMDTERMTRTTARISVAVPVGIDEHTHTHAHAHTRTSLLRAQSPQQPRTARSYVRRSLQVRRGTQTDRSNRDSKPQGNKGGRIWAAAEKTGVYQPYKCMLKTQVFEDLKEDTKLPDLVVMPIDERSTLFDLFPSPQAQLWVKRMAEITQHRTHTHTHTQRTPMFKIHTQLQKCHTHREM